MADTTYYRFRVRRGVAANWSATNEVPLAGEFCLETDSKRLKIGDGATAYNALKYVESGMWLRALGDVDASAIADGYVPTWNAAAGKHIYKRAGAVYVPGIGVTIDSSNPDSPVISSTVAAVSLKGRVATYGGLPSSANANGDAWLVDADNLVYVWNGAAWQASGNGLSVSTGGGETPPKIASFPTVVGSGATLTDKSGRLDVQLPQTVFMHALYQACPAPPYTIDMHVSLNVPSVAGSDAVVAGLALSDGTKVRGYYMGYWGASTTADRLSIDSWTNSTTFGAQVSFQTPFKHFECKNHYIRITDNGTSRIYYLSTDGKRFFQMYSEATNTYLTPSRVGLFFHNINTTGTTPAKVSIFNYKVTNAILGDSV